MSIELPAKLQRDLRKSEDHHVQAVLGLIEHALANHRYARLRSTQRYSALYDGPRRPVVYIEPQQGRVLLGFHPDHVERLRPPPSTPSCDSGDKRKRQWNPSEGGLTWYALEGSAQALATIAADLQRMINEAYR